MAPSTTHTELNQYRVESIYSTVVSLPRHPQVAEWLGNLDVTTRALVDDALAYLEEFGRAAALPDVRHHISQSAHARDMSEVRVFVDELHVYRVLVGFGPDDRPALLLAGNKARIGNPWYDANVPIADERLEIYREALRKATTSNTRGRPKEEP